MIEAIPSSDTSIITRATRRHIPEDGVVHSHRRKSLKSYMYGLLISSRGCEDRVHRNRMIYDAASVPMNPVKCDGELSGYQLTRRASAPCTWQQGQWDAAPVLPLTGTDRHERACVLEAVEYKVLGIRARKIN
jgi:hypothetical protein